MSIHSEESPLANKTVKIKANVPEIGGMEYRVEDWWDRVSGKSWKSSNGNQAAMNYAFRAGRQGLPIDDEVLYGKAGLGYLVHISEIES